MYVVIRKFRKMRSVAEAARRAESGIGQMLKNSPGFRGYYVFDAGDGAGGSVSLFEDKETALAANEKAMAWVKGSLADLIEGEVEVTVGNVLVAMTPPS
jgi:hypothetical protein